MPFPFVGSIAAAFRNTFKDTFSRTNQSGLGTATDGSIWPATAVRGTWSITSSRATGNDANYPMAAVEMGTANVNISLQSALQGTAAALWITDSGNWWAVGLDQTQASCNCQTCTAYVSGNYVPGNYVSGNYVSGTTFCSWWQNSNGSCPI